MHKAIHRFVIFMMASACSVADAQTSDPALNVLVKKGIITEQEAKQAIADQDFLATSDGRRDRRDPSRLND